MKSDGARPTAKPEGEVYCAASSTDALRSGQLNRKTEEAIKTGSIVSIAQTVNVTANNARSVLCALALSATLACLCGCVDAGAPAEDFRTSNIATRLKAAMADYCAQAATFSARAKTAATPAENFAVTGHAKDPDEEGFGAAPTQEQIASSTPSTSTSRLLAPKESTPAPSACGAAVELSSEPFAYASTNGKRVRISRAMLRLASDDSELAFVIAHEFSHILLHHSFSFGMDSEMRRRQEFEADYFGIYVVARAGYDLDKASRFIVRLARAMPGIDGSNPDYPSSTERYAELDRAVSEIKRKMQAKLVLAPSFEVGDGSNFGFIPHLP